ncbi:UNKNOWN [Stylonychia lemnae]|uniref:Uncharacterized protein n=1 Tax=Stylonychia lemnae TaxID=5949 RepID=A0A078A915_STYLE|nr:UNKNOWN [Stylonychia lemnae]|eukprot:CDW78709.1 UNKNOWN [Stylonychia lemnae]
MGNCICTVDKCSDNTSSPFSYVEYEENLKNKQSQILNKERMDVMGSAWYQAMHDVKYLLGRKAKIDDDDSQNGNEDTAREIQKLREYYLKNTRKDSDASKSSSVAQRREDLYNDYIRQKKQQAANLNRQETKIRKHKLKAINQFKKKTFFEMDPNGSNKNEINFITPKLQMNMKPHLKSSSINLRDVSTTNNTQTNEGSELFTDRTGTSVKVMTIHNGNVDDDRISETSYLTIKVQEVSDGRSSVSIIIDDLTSQMSGQQSDQSLMIKRVSNSQGSQSSMSSYVNNYSSSNISQSQMSSNTNIVRVGQVSRQKSGQLKSVSNSSFNHSSFNESQIIRGDFEEDSDAIQRYSCENQSQIQLSDRKEKMSQDQIHLNVFDIRQSFGRKYTKSQCGDHEYDEFASDLRQTQQFEFLANMQPDDINYQISEKANSNKRLYYNDVLDQENNNPNVVKKKAPKKLDKNLYIKKEYEIDELDENFNYQSDNSFQTPFKSHLKMAQTTKNHTLQKESNEKLEEPKMTFSFKSVDSNDEIQVQFLETSFDNQMPLIQCRESFGIPTDDEFIVEGRLAQTLNNKQISAFFGQHNNSFEPSNDNLSQDIEPNNSIEY